MNYSEFCPRLFTMVQKGIGYHELQINMIGNICCKRNGNYFIRAYRYEGFKEDFMLAQQFNFEYQILQRAKEEKCKNIVSLATVKLSDTATFFVLERYEMDLRWYL